MRERVRRIAKLIHIKPARDLLREPRGDILIIFRMTAGDVRPDDAHFRAERAHVRNFLLRHLVGNDEQHAITFRSRDKRQTEAGVASGCLDHRPPRLQFSFRLGRFNHGKRDTVLD